MHAPTEPHLIAILTLLACFAVGRAAVAQSPAMLELTVTDAATFEPIAGAAVRGGNQRTRGVTDAAGKFVMRVEPGADGATMIVSAADHVPMLLRWGGAAGPVPATYDLALPIAAPIGGRVVDDAGQAVSGATVVLQIEPTPDPAKPAERTYVSYERVKTAADGTWRYDNAPVGFASARLGVYHADFVSHAPALYAPGAPPGYFDLKQTAAAGLRDKSATLTLERGRPIRGTVVDEAGQPLRGVRVGLGTDRVASNVAPEVRTGGDGTFTLAARAGETITLTALDPRHAPQQATFKMPDAEHAVTLKLGPPKTLSGRVVDARGQPVPQAYVFVDGWHDTRTVQQRLRTDSGGRFTWPGAPADEVKVDAMADGYGTRRGIAMSPDKNNLVTLPDPLTFTGTVVDAATGKPVTAFKAYRGIDFKTPKQPVYFSNRDDLGRQLKSLGDGKFEVQFMEQYPALAVRITADGYLPADSPSFAMDAGPQAFEFRLKAAKGIAGDVVDAAGEPAAGARVAVLVANRPTSIQDGHLGGLDDNDRTMHTDTAGHFSGPPVEGAYRLAAVHEAGGVAEIDSVAFAKFGKITLVPWGTIDGVARVGSRPLASAAVSVSSMPAAEDPAGQRTPHVYLSYNTHTDAQGHFHVDRVAAGTYAVGRVLVIGPETSSTAAWVPAVVTGGQTATVKLGGTGRPVVGRIDLPDGLKAKPWAMADVRLATHREPWPFKAPANFDALPEKEKQALIVQWSQTDAGKAWFADQEKVNKAQKFFTGVLTADGTYRIDDVAAGTYDLTIDIQAVPPGDANVMRRVAGATTTVTVPPPPDGNQTDDPVTVPPLKGEAAKE